MWRRRTSKRLTPPAHTGKPTRLRLPRLTILQHRPQALGRFSAWVCPPTSPRVLKVAVRRFVQVRAPRCLPGSAVLSYERRRDGCRVEAGRTRDCTFSDTARSRACRPCLAHRGSARAEALGDHFAGGLDPAAVTSPLVAEDGGPGWTSEQRVPGEIAVQRLCAPWATWGHIQALTTAHSGLRVVLEDGQGKVRPCRTSQQQGRRTAPH